MKSVKLNQDLGGGLRLVGLTKSDDTSKEVSVSLLMGTTAVSYTFSTVTRKILQTNSLSPTQTQLIASAVGQFLR